MSAISKTLYNTQAMSVYNKRLYYDIDDFPINEITSEII